MEDINKLLDSSSNSYEINNDIIYKENNHNIDHIKNEEYINKRDFYQALNSINDNINNIYKEIEEKNNKNFLIINNNAEMEKNMTIYPYNNNLNNYPPIYNNPFINIIPLPYVYPNIYSNNSSFNTNN